MKLINIDEAVNYLKDVVKDNEQLVDVLCALSKMPEYDHWNYCEDCMPEDDCDEKRRAITVLATTKSGKVVKIQRTRAGYRDAGWHWTGDFDVVAWMHLPKAFKLEN